jgi:hypothetical protein
MKRIELFTFTCNDQDILPFFIKHYEKIVDRMTFIDSESNDDTLKIIRDHRIIKTGLKWWDWDTLHNMRDNIWRQSEYDMIMFPDVDEFFYRPDLKEFLNITNFEIYQMQGFQMVSSKFPSRPGMEITELNRGVPLPLHNKYTIFSPKADIHFVDAHNIATASNKINRFDIKLLHYKYLGVENMMRRAKLIQSRVPRNSTCRNIGGNIFQKFSSFI